MTNMIYAATVPCFLQILECQSGLIHKAAAHAHAKNIPVDTILRARRSPKDHSFRAHVRLGANAAVNGVDLLTGRPANLPREAADDLASLNKLLASAKEYLMSAKEEHFMGYEGKEFTVNAPGGGASACSATELVFSFTYPIFYYHAVSVHSILMQLGVGIQRSEFYNPPG